MSPSMIPPTSPPPERWTLDAGDADVATLVVPPDARRERCFEVACAMQVRVPPGSTAAWHRLTVLVDGRREWQRRIDTHLDDGSDGLDHHFRRTVPPGSGSVSRPTCNRRCGNLT